MKQHFHKKRIILTTLMAVVGLSTSNLALADSSSFSKAITQVGNKIVALGFAGMAAVNNAMHQFDQNLANILVTNTAAKTVSQNARTATTKTNHFIQASFQNIPNSILSTGKGMLNTFPIMLQVASQKALVKNLTIGTPGSDTLYSNNPLVIFSAFTDPAAAPKFDYYNSKVPFSIGPPKLNHDNYFNVGSVLSPTSYTPAQAEAAKAYMQYLTQSYQNPADGLDLSKLRSHLNNFSGSKKYIKQFEALIQLMKSAPYQQYQLALRSNMAMKSVGINSFNHLIVERTPSTKKVSGVYNSLGFPISHPSPLQVEAYQANYRVNNPQWMTSLQSMSSTTLQREIAVELAEVIHQNYQAHLDRERLLTVMSSLELQSANMASLQIQTKAGAVNQVISHLK